MLSRGGGGGEESITICNENRVKLANRHYKSQVLILGIGVNLIRNFLDLVHWTIFYDHY